MLMNSTPALSLSLSLTHTHTQPANLTIPTKPDQSTGQCTGRTRSSSVVTLAQPSVSSSLQIKSVTNRSLRCASHYLCYQYPHSFRQPHQSSVYSPPGSPYPWCKKSHASSFTSSQTSLLCRTTLQNGTAVAVKK